MVQSVIGRNVRVGRNVDIVGSYVQDGVVIMVGVRDLGRGGLSRPHVHGAGKGGA